VDMALIRLCYASDLPGPEEALKALRDGAPGEGGGGHGGGSPSSGGGGLTATARMTAPAPREAVKLESFADVVALIDARRDISLKLDVERYVRPISFRPGAITYEPAPGAPSSLAQRLVARLKEWTGQPWLVAAEGGGGAESAWEKEKREEREDKAQIEADPFVRSVMQAFPGAEIIGVRRAPLVEAAPVEDGDAVEDEE